MNEEVKKSSLNNMVKLDLNDHSIFRELESNLLDELRQTYEREGALNDDLLESLYFLYKNPLLEALNQIDKSSTETAVGDQNITGGEISMPKVNLVTLIKCDTEPTRKVYQVKGSMGLNYYIFENVNFCTCSSFKFNVMGKNDFVYCKHVIMVKLLSNMGKLNERLVKSAEMADILRQIH